MDRFTHIDKPTALPGSCVFCGRAEDSNGFVDTQCELDFHGALQVCYRCVKAMYDAFGFDASARAVINENAVANVHQLAETFGAFEDELSSKLAVIHNNLSNLANYFERSHEVLVQASGARERIIQEAADRANESLGLSELGFDSDELRAKS